MPESKQSPQTLETADRFEAFTTLDVAEAVRRLESLYDQVVLNKGRVVITREGCADDGEDCCVIISRSELEGLERALELLSDGDGVRAMHETLRVTFARLAADETGAGE